MLTDDPHFSGPPWNSWSGWDMWVHVNVGWCSACLSEIRNGRTYIPDNELPARVPILQVDPDSGSGICQRHAQEAFAKYDQAVKGIGRVTN